LGVEGVPVANSTLSDKVQRFIELLFAFLLFGTQTILNAGVFISIMSIPLLPYLFYALSGQYSIGAIETEVWAMLFLDTFLVGRIIALVGVAVLLVAAAQLIWSRRKHAPFTTTGAYSVVRHPQFTGIIVVTFGLSVMVLTNSTGRLFQVAGLWLLQILGYIMLAKFEEWRLTKKLGDSYYNYKRKVSFLFPMKRPQRLPELLFTIFIAILLFTVLLVLPYEQIRIYSSKLFLVALT
jgi:protein-S-isoprenylcysteine O-methyltransferase Ste14